jgi:hypothetical protein
MDDFSAESISQEESTRMVLHQKGRIPTVFSNATTDLAQAEEQELTRGTWLPRLKQIAFLSLVFASAIQGESYGSLPRLSVNPIDIFSAISLPLLKDNSGTPLTSSVDALQVGNRAAVLSLSSASATAAWQNAQNVLNERATRPTRPPAAKTVVFEERRPRC